MENLGGGDTLGPCGYFGRARQGGVGNYTCPSEVGVACLNVDAWNLGRHRLETTEGNEK